MAAQTLQQPSFLLVSLSVHTVTRSYVVVQLTPLASGLCVVLIFVFFFCVQANLKADSTTKSLLQRCQDLVKIIDEYPAKVPANTVLVKPVHCTFMFAACEVVCVGQKWTNHTVLMN